MSDNLVKRLRVCAGDQGGWMYGEAADRIEGLERALQLAAGYISTKEGHTDQHPQDVYDWIIRTTSENKNDK